MSFGGTALAVMLVAVPAAAQDSSEVYFGQTVAEVRFEIDGPSGGAVESQASLRELVDVRAGQPLRRDDVRTSMDHLFALGRYEDIRPIVDRTTTGVVVTFRLLPRYPINRVEVDVGSSEVSTSTLINELRQRYVGRAPGVVRTEAVEDFVHRHLNDDGYLSPVVEASTVVAPGSSTATLVVKVEAGALAPIASANVENASPLSGTTVLSRAGVASGLPYRRREIQTRLTAIEDDLRSRGYYEAQTSIEEKPTTAGVALTINVQAGPHVELRIQPPGSLPGSTGDLIPIERERSADQDLLEDSQARIEGVLRREGYAQATAPFSIVLSPDGQTLVVTFTINRGARHYIDRLEIPPTLAVPSGVLRGLIGVSPGTEYNQAGFEAGVAAAINEYRRRGYYQAVAEPSFEPLAERTTPTETWLILHPGITEGPRAQVAAVTFTFEGVHQLPEAELRQQLRSRIGAPYVELDAVLDQDGLLSYYRNRGFLSAAVALDRRVGADGAKVELAFTVNEGPQILIGRITVLGHERVSEQQILEELRLAPGQPMSMAALAAARQRLADMGVFRSFSVEAADRLSGETEGHLVVTVVEAAATTFGFGLGLEGGSRVKRDEQGTALADVVDLAPRGFVEIGRRHIGGRNRAVNMFARVGLRRSDRENLSETVQEARFTEYRVTGTFREQHAFRSETDLLVSFTSEQAVRPTYNYVRQELNAEFLRRLTPRVNLSGQYTLDFTRLFDERIPDEDQPLIDRLFPQVRLSYVTGGLTWDGRDRPLTPTRGTLLTAHGAVAARAIGSEVGYVKGFFQAVNFRPIRSTPGTVLALRGQLGLARGFARSVTVVGPAGDSITNVLRDVPVSERYFAGGSTTVRGFALDRLGLYDPECVPCSVINPTTSLSVGGNAVVVLNAELRRALTSISNHLALVGFVDGGNVFSRVADLDLGEIRGAAGFGVRYDSPIGPLRLDFGFKFDRLVIGERLERAWEYHLSIGEAF